MSPPASESIEDVTGADGVRLRVNRTGAGPPVVLLHGFPEDHRAWNRQIAALAEAGFALLIPDLRGYGASDKPAGVNAYRLQSLVDDIAAIAHVAGPPIHLVGHDWGGVIAWTFATAHPKLLSRLVILNAPHPQAYARALWRSSQLLKSWYALFFQLPRLPERVLSAGDFRLLRAIYRCGAAKHDAFSDEDIENYINAFRQPRTLTAALNYYRANLRIPPMRSAARIDAKTLVIWGERDPSLSIKLIGGLNQVAPNVAVHRVPEAGHFVQREAPETVNRLLLDFL